MNTFYLPGNNIPYFVESEPAFRWSIWPPSSVLKSKLTQLSLVFDPEDGGDMFLRSVWQCSN
jgi:hypothetical protein